MNAIVPHVTPVVWSPKLLRHPSYGERETYRLAASWVADCRTVADWGAGPGFLQQFLPTDVTYTPVDGTAHGTPGEVLADVATYTERADGIVLRHVLDMAPNWQRVLGNALLAFRRRLVVVTFTPDVAITAVQKVKSGWPLWHFNPDELRWLMLPYLVAEAAVGVERVYYLEKREPGLVGAIA